jgi:DNA (cytosine-5)-methyltransferase 1
MIAKRKKPTLIDLFAGVGGLSLGGARAGFEIAGAVDINERVMEAHRRNFPNTHHLIDDLSKISGSELLRKLDVVKPDGIIGGPPCQGFSVMGHRNATDDRNTLFSHFFRLVSEIRPRFFVAENVAGILDPNYSSIVASALEHVDSDYDVIRGIEVCASDFGVPTSRRRVLFIGTLPNESGFNRDCFESRSRSKAVHVSDALFGLPVVRSDWKAEDQGWRVVHGHAKTSFGKRLNGCVPTGVGCLESLERLRKHSEVSGCLGTAHTPDVKRRFKNLKQGSQDPISKCVRLRPDGFCPTLRAGTGPELGSYQAVRPIHPTSPRVITPREAARLQGFPDWFRFDATKWHSFRMIGNSVSPILAERILSQIVEV